MSAAKEVRAAAVAAGAREPAPFFDLNAKYLIAPGASVDDLRDDFRCLYLSGMGAIYDAEGAEMFSSAQWGGIYMLRQAFAVFEELERVMAATARGEI